MAPVNRFFAQDADVGALSTLYAATEPGLEGGVFIGPDGVGEMRGHPTRVSPSKTARDETVARMLWDVSEEMTGVKVAPAVAAT